MTRNLWYEFCLDSLHLNNKAHSWWQYRNSLQSQFTTHKATKHANELEWIKLYEAVTPQQYN